MKRTGIKYFDNKYFRSILGTPIKRVLIWDVKRGHFCVLSIKMKFYCDKLLVFRSGPLECRKISIFVKKRGQKPEKWPFLAPVHRQKGEKRVF